MANQISFLNLNSDYHNKLYKSKKLQKIKHLIIRCKSHCDVIVKYLSNKKEIILYTM